MTIRTALSCLLLACAATALPAAHAAILTFEAELTGGQENPPNASPGSGQGRVEIDTVLRTLRLDLSFMNLLAGTTASHIHCCAPPSGNAGVATQVPTFVGFPLGVTSGTYSQTFDMTLPSSWNPAFILAQGGTPMSAFDVLVLNLLAGQAYLNIHTTQFPGGEIRGNLQKVAEPATLALLLIAGVALVAAARRRRPKPAARR
jgi:hypothetical protein